MRKALTLPHLLMVLLLVAGCGGSDTKTAVKELDDVLPTDNPLDPDSDDEADENIPELSVQFKPIPDYAAEDFGFDEDVLYWEVKMGPLESAENGTVDTAWRFDADHYQALSDEQRAEVDAAESSSGFKSACLPDQCVVFGVAVTGGETELLTTHSELLAFFGDIDSEAKLNLWLWANDYHGLTYEAVDGGYESIAKMADPRCREDPYYRLFVDAAGVITEVETVATLNPGLCP